MSPLARLALVIGLAFGLSAGARAQTPSTFLPGPPVYNSGGQLIQGIGAAKLNSTFGGKADWPLVLPSGVTGTLPIANGGTGATTGAGAVNGLALPVNIALYGALPGNTPAANATDIEAAMAANPVVTCTPGLTYNVASIVIPATLASFSGACTLVASGTYTAGTAVLSATAPATPLAIRDVTVQVAPSYTTNPGIFITGATGALVSHVNAEGYFGINIANSTDSNVTDSTVESATAGGIGIYLLDTSQSAVRGNHIAAVSGTQEDIAVQGGAGVTVAANSITDSGTTSFGIGMADDGKGLANSSITNFSVVGNAISGTSPECVNVTNGNTGTISGNTCLFNGNSLDFGMSVVGSDATAYDLASDINISGNTIVNSCKSGIAIASYAFRIHVSGNYIVNPDNCNGTTFDYKSGILVYGANSGSSVIAGNFIDDTNNYTAQLVGEANSGGPPGNDVVGTNFYLPAYTGAQYALIGTGSYAIGQPTNIVSGAATAPSSSTAFNVGSFTLARGTWSISAQVYFTATATLTAVYTGINTTSATFPLASTPFAQTNLAGFSAAGEVVPLKTTPLVLTAPSTIVYVVGECSYASGSCTAVANISATRVN